MGLHKRAAIELMGEQRVQLPRRTQVQVQVHEGIVRSQCISLFMWVGTGSSAISCVESSASVERAHRHTHAVRSIGSKEKERNETQGRRHMHWHGLFLAMEC